MTFKNFRGKRVIHKEEVDKAILEQAKRNGDIIYGGQALNKQLLPMFKRRTEDYDIYTKHPKKSARKLEKKLDKKFGGDYFYTKRAIHPKTHRVMDKGGDLRRGTRDDFAVADFTSKPRGVKTKRIKGNVYTSLSHISKGSRKVLKDPASKYRWDKEKDALRRIKHSRKQKKY